MSEAVGPVDLRVSEEHPFLGREMAQPRHFSESSAQAVDAGVRELINGAEGRATDVLRQHVAALERLVEALESQEDIGRERIEVLLGQRAGAEDRRAAGRDGASRCKGS